MKALSVREEAFFEILGDEKTAEYRTWPTDHRGDLLLCVTATPYRQGYAAGIINIKDCVKLPVSEGGGYAWTFDPEETKLIYYFAIKGKQRLFDVDDALIRVDEREELTEAEKQECREFGLSLLTERGRKLLKKVEAVE